MIRNMSYYPVIVFTLIIAVGGLPCAATAGITWDGEFDEFRFAVQDNGGFFIHIISPNYVKPSSSDTDECRYSPSQSLTDRYDCVATGNLTEYEAPPNPPGEINLNAMAKGPNGGVSPSNGLKVQGYLETVPSGLTLGHGIDINQEVISWVSRKFSVNQSGEYSLSALLNGTVQFNDYENSSNDKALYEVSGEVIIEKIIDSDIFTILILDLDELDSTVTENVLLENQTNGKSVSYRLKATLYLQSEIVNYDLNRNTVSQTIDQTFKLGSETSPFTLEAKIRPKGKGGVSSWMNLLLNN